jgi:hypothetical protein
MRMPAYTSPTGLCIVLQYAEGLCIVLQYAEGLCIVLQYAEGWGEAWEREELVIDVHDSL